MRARPHLAFLVTATVCLVVFAWMVSFGTFRLVAEDTFGSFYDHQAAAWLRGRWDVPEPALSGEAFVVDGKVYGYFGPTPAVLRLPFVALGLGFGQLTRPMLLLDFAACLLAAYALLRLAFRWRDPSACPSALATVLFTATVGLGSTLFFLGSRAYVYHEAILCGAAFGLWSAYATLRYLQAPASGRRWWLIALACGVLAVHARPPIGLFALTFLGSAALAVVLQTRSPRPLLIGVLCALGVLSFNLVSYVKFKTFEGCPLRLNVQYTPAQLDVLEHRNFHLSNLRFNADAYLLRPAVAVTPQFPYVYREYLDRKQYPESRMAYRDQTLAMPYAMPGLFALATIGSLLAAVAAPAVRRPLAVAWLAALPAALAMLTAVAVTQRYTADFSPVLIVAAAFALAGFDALTPTVRRLAFAASALLALLGIAVTFALTLHNQREIVWGVPEEYRRDYQLARARIDAFFGVAPEAPPAAPAAPR